MRGFLVLGTILASLVAWLFWAAPHSQADRYVYAVTRVEWQGSPCIDVAGAGMANPYQVGFPVAQCSSGPPGVSRWAQWTESRSSGQYVGVDPIMGVNNWASCTLWINGAVEVIDYASAGDGTDVSCLRVVN